MRPFSASRRLRASPGIDAKFEAHLNEFLPQAFGKSAQHQKLEAFRTRPGNQRRNMADQRHGRLTDGEAVEVEIDSRALGEDCFDGCTIDANPDATMALIGNRGFAIQKWRLAENLCCRKRSVADDEPLSGAVGPYRMRSAIAHPRDQALQVAASTRGENLQHMTFRQGSKRDPLVR